MTVNEVYKIVQYLANKYQGGYISPEEFNRVINMAQNMYMYDSAYKINAGISNRFSTQMNKGMNQLNTENLAAFIVTGTISAPSGVANKPADIFRIIAMRTSSDKMIRRVEQDRWYGWVNSVIDVPSTSQPIYTETNEQYQFSPAVSNAKIIYIRQPRVISWAYTLSGGRPVYNPSPSSDPEWDDAQMYEIILRALNMVGVNLRDGDLMKAANVVKKDVEE